MLLYRESGSRYTHTIISTLGIRKAQEQRIIRIKKIYTASSGNFQLRSRTKANPQGDPLGDERMESSKSEKESHRTKDHLSSRVIVLWGFLSMFLSTKPPEAPGVEAGARDNDLGLSKSTFARLLDTEGMPVPVSSPSSSTASSSLLRFLARLIVGADRDIDVVTAAVAGAVF